MNRSNSGGIGFLGALTILLIGLKLTGHVDWSWWLVTSAMWGSALLVVLVVLLALLATYLGDPIRRWLQRRRRARLIRQGKERERRVTDEVPVPKNARWFVVRSGPYTTKAVYTHGMNEEDAIQSARDEKEKLPAISNIEVHVVQAVDATEAEDMVYYKNRKRRESLD